MERLKGLIGFYPTSIMGISRQRKACLVPRRRLFPAGNKLFPGLKSFKATAYYRLKDMDFRTIEPESMMKCLKLLVTVLLVGVTIGAADSGWAHDRHHSRARVGVFIGAPLWPWYYSPPLYYPPAVITVPAPPPPVYIEQQPSPPSAQNYWYYCPSPEGYYPYVKECPGGWQKVAPQP